MLEDAFCELLLFFKSLLQNSLEMLVSIDEEEATSPSKIELQGGMDKLAFCMGATFGAELVLIKNIIYPLGLVREADYERMKEVFKACLKEPTKEKLKNLSTLYSEIVGAIPENASFPKAEV